MPIARDPTVRIVLNLPQARHHIKEARRPITPIAHPGQSGHDTIDRTCGATSADDATVIGDFNEKRRMPTISFTNASALPQFD